jgi:hypothetical protein
MKACDNGSRTYRSLWNGGHPEPSRGSLGAESLPGAKSKGSGGHRTRPVADVPRKIAPRLDSRSFGTGAGRYLIVETAPPPTHRLDSAQSRRSEVHVVMAVCHAALPFPQCDNLIIPQPMRLAHSLPPAGRVIFQRYLPYHRAGQLRKIHGCADQHHRVHSLGFESRQVQQDVSTHAQANGPSIARCRDDRGAPEYPACIARCVIVLCGLVELPWPRASGMISR